MAKYGQIVAAYNLSAGASGGAVGLNTERGIVFTNKGWARKYTTIYYSPGLAAPSGTIGFSSVFALPSQHPTFSDWQGAMIGFAGSYDYISGNAGFTSSYAVFGIGLSYSPYNVKAAGTLNLGVTRWNGPA